MTDSVIPEGYRYLLDELIYPALGTVRPDNTVQVNPMWFLFDGEHLRFTHTTTRAKYRNLQANPSMSACFVDPTNGYKYVEVRGQLIETIPDPEGEFYQVLSRRYGNVNPPPPKDKADRVVLVMSIEHTTTQ